MKGGDNMGGPGSGRRKNGFSAKVYKVYKAQRKGKVFTTRHANRYRAAHAKIWKGATPTHYAR